MCERAQRCDVRRRGARGAASGCGGGAGGDGWFERHTLSDEAAGSRAPRGSTPPAWGTQPVAWVLEHPAGRAREAHVPARGAGARGPCGWRALGADAQRKCSARPLRTGARRGRNEPAQPRRARARSSASCGVHAPSLHAPRQPLHPQPPTHTPMLRCTGRAHAPLTLGGAVTRGSNQRRAEMWVVERPRSGKVS